MPFHSNNVQQNRLRLNYDKRDWQMYKELSSGDISDEQKRCMNLHHKPTFHLHVQLFVLRKELGLDLREQGKSSLEFAQWANMNKFYLHKHMYVQTNIYHVTIH